MLDPVSIGRWILAIGATVFWGSLSFFSSLIDSSGKSSHRCMVVWGRWCLAIGGIRLEVRGLDRFDSAGPYVVVSNHQGQVDVLILASVLPFQFLWVAKKELFTIPFMGWHMKRSGYISIDRENPERAISSVSSAAERLAKKRSIIFFPEGARSRDGHIQRFKSGAFRLASETGTPILPVIIDGSFHVLQKGSLRVHPRTVVVEFFAPLTPVSKDLKEKDRLKQTVWDMMRERIEGDFDAQADVR